MNDGVALSEGPQRGTVVAVRAWLVLFGIFTLTLAGGCKNPPRRLGGLVGGERPPPPVTIATAITRDVPVYLDEIGSTKASEIVNIQSQVEGQIVERRFKDGDDLRVGQVLYIIDSRMYLAKVAEAEANLELARAQLELARADFNRVANAPRTAVSQEDIDTKKGALDNALAQVKVGQASVDTANLTLSYCTITSPIEGRAGQRMVDVGNIVKTNDTTMLQIQKLAPIYADFSITERDLPEVRDRIAADKSSLHAQVTVPERTSKVGEGVLTFLDTMVQPGAGRIRLRATLENKDMFFWAGQFVNVRLVLHTIPAAVLVPYQCVQIGQNGPYVYVVDGSDAAKMHPVKLGQRQGDLIVVEKGVTPGDRVVQTGQLSVSPEAKVRIVTPAGEALASTPTSAPATSTAPTPVAEGSPK